MQRFKNLYHLLTAFTANLWYRFPSKNMTVIGITGTDGKTTTTHLISHILRDSGLPVSYVSSIEANITGKKFETGFHVTTPSSWQLQRFIKMAKDSGTQYLILEITSHALDQFRSFGVEIDISVITNISHEHLDYHKDMKNYISAKSKILKNSKYAVLNADEDNFAFLSKKARGKVISYSLKNNHLKDEVKFPQNARLIGRFNQYNILAAFNVARLLNISSEKINVSVSNFPGVPGRLEEVKTDRRFKIIIDFAHKINALRQVLTAVKKITPNRLIAVFGSAGLRDHLKRPIMGKVAAELADLTVLTAEDPRTEDVRVIINQIAQGFKSKGIMELNKNFEKNELIKGKKYFFKIPDRQEAINFAVRKLAGRGDTVIVCGKGHEKSMCYGKIEYPWDEKQAILKAVYGTGKNTQDRKIN